MLAIRFFLRSAYCSIVPVDGKVASGRALLDKRILTGESLPVLRNVGDDVLSGSSSLDTAFDVIATRPASQSTYAGIVRLVQAAQEAKAPMVRLADRFALWFLALTVLLAGGTWMITGEHLRMLAVLVSATPCPLILAVPVAIISGISKAARVAACWSRAGHCPRNPGARLGAGH